MSELFYTETEDLSIDFMGVEELDEAGFVPDGATEDWIVLSVTPVVTKLTNTVIILSELKGWFSGNSDYHAIPKDNRRTKLEVMEYLDFMTHISSY